MQKLFFSDWYYPSVILKKQTICTLYIYFIYTMYLFQGLCSQNAKMMYKAFTDVWMSFVNKCR